MHLIRRDPGSQYSFVSSASEDVYSVLSKQKEGTVMSILIVLRLQSLLEEHKTIGYQRLEILQVS